MGAITGLPSQPAGHGRVNLWLAGLALTLGLLVLAEGGIILALWRAPGGHRRGAGRIAWPAHWLAADSQVSGRSVPAGAEDIIWWESAQDLDAIHAQIIRLFDALAAAEAGYAGSAPAALPAPRSDLAAERLFGLRGEIDRIFQGAVQHADVLSLPGRLEQGWNLCAVSPSLRVNETDERIEVSLALPGVDAAAIAVSLQGRLLTIALTDPAGQPGRPAGGTAERRQETKLLLGGPANAAGAQAVFRDGVLRIAIPKAQVQDQLVRTIKVI